MTLLIASAESSAIEQSLNLAGHSCLVAPSTAALKRIGQGSFGCVVVACRNLEELSIWTQGLKEFASTAPSVVVSEDNDVLAKALDTGAMHVCHSNDLELLPALVSRSCELNTRDREAKELFDRVYSLEEDNKSLLENIIDVVTVLDIKGTITYESPSVKRALGYEQPELVGKNAFSLIHPLDVPRVLPVFMLGVATPGSPLAAKFRFRHKDGSWAYLESLGKALHTPEGLRVMVTSRIVTEKAHLTTLGQTETRFMNVVEGLGEGLFIADKNSKISYANSRLTQMTGYTQEELIGATTERVFLLREGIQEFEQRRALTLNGKSDEIELEMRRKNGTTFWTHINLTPYVDHEGTIIGSLAAVTNITERRLAEGKLEEARVQLEQRVEELAKAKFKAEEMSRLKSAFLANMSHEIRTPMNSILGFASVLRDELHGEESEEYAAMIESSGKRLLTTINGILDLARIESNKMELNPQPINLAVELKDILQSLSPLARQKGIDLRFAPTHKLQNSTIELDPMGLAQIVTNLAGNAIKFTERGFVEVIADVQFSHQRDQSVESGVTIYIMDSGVGISEEFLPHIFDEFKQESSGWARDYEGTGLGLTITKKLVDLMRGEITVTSSRGKGATFKLWLPAPVKMTADVESDLVHV